MNLSIKSRLWLGSATSVASLLLLWIVSFSAGAFVAALSAVLGGFVLLGSNATTWQQTEAALHTAEAERAKLIGSIELRLVGEDRPTLH